MYIVGKAVIYHDFCRSDKNGKTNKYKLKNVNGITLQINTSLYNVQ